jgi:heat shock protein 5
MDVNPLTMGIEVKGGAMSNIIPRNSHIPIVETEPFTTTTDNQEVVSIRIFEGERPLTKDNHFLGEFDLTGIPLAQRGVPQIHVTFDIDVNGILNVSVTYRSFQKLLILSCRSLRKRKPKRTRRIL